MRSLDGSDVDCSIAAALGVVGDWWTLLVIRDVAGGVHRFDALQGELGVSRKVLTERLKALVEHGVLERRQYHAHPPRYEYHLSPAGLGLLPVLVALQDWGSRFVMGDGTLTATTRANSLEARRVHALVGSRVPVLSLRTAGGAPVDPVADAPWTVVYCFPGAYAPATAYPPGWASIPGTAGCTLESRTYRNRLPEFTSRGATVVGVSTQRPDELAAFALSQDIAFPMLSDAELELVAALRLPTFRAAGVDRLKRLTLLLDGDRKVRAVLYPITDPAGSVGDALTLIDEAEAANGRVGRAAPRRA
jgi:DNA-binding HxlR family transcriptional regulator/peroxiredoxin